MIDNLKVFKVSKKDSSQVKKFFTILALKNNAKLIEYKKFKGKKL
jgi:hypothetical protein